LHFISDRPRHCDRLRLKFQFPDAVSPRQIGISEDPRNLSIALRRLKLTQLFGASAMNRTLDSLPSAVTLAKEASASARNAARPRGMADRLLNRLFPKREHRIQRTLDAIDTLIDHVVAGRSEYYDRALSCLKQESLLAFTGMTARTDAAQSRIVDLEQIVRGQMATRDALTELQQRYDADLSQLHTDSAALRAATDLDGRRIAHLEESLRERTATRAALQTLRGDIESSIREALAATAALSHGGDLLAARVDSVERQAAEELATRSALSSIQATIEQKLTDVAAAVDANSSTLAQQITRLEQANVAAQAALAGIQVRLEAARAEHSSLKEMQSRMEQAVGILAKDVRNVALPALDTSDAAFASIIERESAQTSRIDRLETVIGEIGSALDHADGIFADSSDFARFYLAFENRYRGSESEIAERLRVFLPRLAAAPAPAAGGDRPFAIDLGCGRGEWQVVGNEGFESLGVDTNVEMLGVCRRKGLKVVESDALTFLRAQPAASASCVTAFHLIEHVPFPTLLALFRECFRVVTPGGLVIFETPSCHNVLVGASNFYSDPTHRRPLPSTLTRFALEYLGFAGVEVLFLHPHPDRMLIPGHDDLASRFNEYFYGAQDYALIAQRPAAV